jgi:hypothetical protein
VFLILPIFAYRPIQITKRSEQKRLVKIRSGGVGWDKLKGGGEEKVLETIRKSWASLRERMKGEDGIGERTITSTFPDC